MAWSHANAGRSCGARCRRGEQCSVQPSTVSCQPQSPCSCCAYRSAPVSESVLPNGPHSAPTSPGATCRAGTDPAWWCSQLTRWGGSRQASKVGLRPPAGGHRCRRPRCAHPCLLGARCCANQLPHHTTADSCHKMLLQLDPRYGEGDIDLGPKQASPSFQDMKNAQAGDHGRAAHVSSQELCTALCSC